MIFGFFELAVIYSIIFIMYYFTLESFQRGNYWSGLKLGLTLSIGSFMMLDVIKEPMKIFFSLGKPGFVILTMITLVFLAVYIYDKAFFFLFRRDGNRQ